MTSWLDRALDVFRLTFLIVKSTIRRFSDEEGMHLAAGIAFYALLSIFPMALLGISVFSYMFEAEKITTWLVEMFGEQTPVSAEFINSTVAGTTSIRGPVGVVGLGGLILSSTLVFAAIMRSINRAWGFIGTGTRTFVKRKLWEFTLLVGMALLFLLAIVAASSVEVLRKGPFPGTNFWLDTDSPYWGFFLAVVPVFVMAGVLILLYKFVPTTRVKWRHVVLPALLAAVALKIANSFLSWYISTLGYYNAVYGSLTSVIVLLMWIYVCANILIVGAALSATLADLSHPPPALYPARKD